jgi:acid stress-induced BolA-like protein IbaG/YrbA
MTTPEQIETWIKSGLNCLYINVAGDGQHFEATIVSLEFVGKTRVAQHQLIYKALGDKMQAEIHALSLRTLTPDEWSSQRG